VWCSPAVALCSDRSPVWYTLSSWSLAWVLIWVSSWSEWIYLLQEWPWRSHLYQREDQKGSFRLRNGAPLH
jgi:hypothetical protein